jgi:hypothetical protein
MKKPKKSKSARLVVSIDERPVAGVFIIESLSLKDEKKRRFEGRILRDMLRLSGKRVEYWYVRTQKELEEIALPRFYKSNLRYLHISCHGDRKTVALTLDNIGFRDFGAELKPYLHDRRLFFSACEVVNQELHDALMADSDCYSLIGPDTEIRFDDAAIMWATFYHLMLRDADSMKSDKIRRALALIKDTFGQTFKYL